MQDWLDLKRNEPDGVGLGLNGSVGDGIGQTRLKCIDQGWTVLDQVGLDLTKIDCTALY